MRQWGKTLQISACLRCPKAPGQHVIKSWTVLGITHGAPNRSKIVSHNCFAIEQCRKRWSEDSPAALHIQHQSTNTTRRFLKLSLVRILPKTAVQTKKATRGGLWSSKLLSKGTAWWCEHSSNSNKSSQKNFCCYAASSTIGPAHYHAKRRSIKDQGKKSEQLSPNPAGFSQRSLPNEDCHS